MGKITNAPVKFRRAVRSVRNFFKGRKGFFFTFNYDAAARAGLRFLVKDEQERSTLASKLRPKYKASGSAMPIPEGAKFFVKHIQEIAVSPSDVVDQVFAQPLSSSNAYIGKAAPSCLAAIRLEEKRLFWEASLVDERLQRAEAYQSALQELDAARNELVAAVEKGAYAEARNEVRYFYERVEARFQADALLQRYVSALRLTFEQYVKVVAEANSQERLYAYLGAEQVELESSFERFSLARQRAIISSSLWAGTNGPGMPALHMKILSFGTLAAALVVGYKWGWGWSALVASCGAFVGTLLMPVYHMLEMSLPSYSRAYKDGEKFYRGVLRDMERELDPVIAEAEQEAAALGTGVERRSAGRDPLLGTRRQDGARRAAAGRKEKA